MNYRFILLGILHVCGLGLYAADMPADTAVVDELQEITVIGSTARQRVSLGRLGAESVPISVLQSLPGFMG